MWVLQLFSMFEHWTERLAAFPSSIFFYDIFNFFIFIIIFLSPLLFFVRLTLLECVEIGTVSSHPKYNHSFMYCCCWEFLITSTHFFFFFFSFISSIIVMIRFVISVNFFFIRYCLIRLCCLNSFLQIELHTFSFPLISYFKTIPFRYRNYAICFFSFSRVVVILPLVIVVFNSNYSYVGIYCSKWTCEYEHSCPLLFILVLPCPCPCLSQSLIYWTWSAMNGYHSASCGKQSFSLSKWRISLSARVWRSVARCVWCEGFFFLFANLY